MKTFITDKFLLQNKTAEKLFYDYAKDMPIIDYHCHLSPQEISEDKKYRSITEMWLDGDHYKWRAIRSAGFKEEQITGHLNDPVFDEERFNIWAEVLPQTLGNPLYHWAHLELLRYFNIDTLLNPKTASEIYQETNKQILSPDFSARKLIEKFQLKFIGTTDDPIDSLEYHQKISNSDLSCKVAPSWRPDKILKIELPTFSSYINSLGKVCNVTINNLEDLLQAIFLRLEYFNQHGCIISDHGLDEFVFTRNFSKEQVDKIFKKHLAGEMTSSEEIIQYKSYILVELGKKYYQYHWVMQLHIGALRNNNTRLFNKLGADIGFDSINDKNYAPELSAYLDTLDLQENLPKTILYSLNPRDNEMLGTMIGNFQGDVPGKIQLGSGWWFNDQKDGMERQITTLASLGLFPRFVGMLTDSRSFLSFSRHEYFRRILCNIIGNWVEEGQAPNDMNYLGTIIQDISFNNAKKYFNI
ncbi:MAG: glucuronate isomerase [Brevinema sp.]